MNTPYLSIIMLCFVLCTFFSTTAQTTLLEQQFNNNHLNNWKVTSGCNISMYTDAKNYCTNNYAIITPAVSSNAPIKVLSQVVNTSKRNVQVQFTVEKYAANLACNTKADFSCPTNVDVILVKDSYEGLDPLNDAGNNVLVNYPDYLLPNAGGLITVFVRLPIGTTKFKTFLKLSTPNNCNQGNSKYVIDNFKFMALPETIGSNNPVANDDYFNANELGFTNTPLKANVYGSNLDYNTNSSNNSFAKKGIISTANSALGGGDYDVDNHALSQMGFSLLSKNFNNADATLTFNNDGTFTFNRINTQRNTFGFSYRLADPDCRHNDACVIVDYAPLTTLGVNFSLFELNLQNEKVQLKWTTETETNNKGFYIQRMTKNDFEDIAFVNTQAAIGNSSRAIQYNFTDNNVTENNFLLYRIKQVDLDGKITYSTIKSIRYNKDLDVSIKLFPNPATQYITVNIKGATTIKANISIIDATGKPVINTLNTDLRSFDVSNLPRGLYTIKVTTDNDIFTERFIKQ